MPLTLLVTPGAPTQGVEDDDVAVASVVKAGVEVQGEVLAVMANIDWKAASWTRRPDEGEESLYLHFA